MLAIKMPNFSKICRSKQLLQWFSEVTPKRFSFMYLWIMSDIEDLKLKCFRVTLQKLL